MKPPIWGIIRSAANCCLNRGLPYIGRKYVKSNMYKNSESMNIELVLMCWRVPQLSRAEQLTREKDKLVQTQIAVRLNCGLRSVRGILGCSGFQTFENTLNNNSDIFFTWCIFLLILNCKIKSSLLFRCHWKSFRTPKLGVKNSNRIYHNTSENDYICTYYLYWIGEVSAHT